MKTKIESDHAHLVAKLKKSGTEILHSLNEDKVDLWHMSTLLEAEAGEFTDAVKGHIIYGKAIDMSNVIEELGDIEFALQGIRQILGIKREDVLLANLEKLSKRYPSGTYSDADAIARVDKNGATNE